MIAECAFPSFMQLPLVPNFKSMRQVTLENEAINVGDVGVTNVIRDDIRVRSFSLIFILEKFQCSSYQPQVKAIPPAFLLGRISNSIGDDCISKISASTNSERKNFSLVLK